MTASVIQIRHDTETGLVLFSISAIRPAPENDLIYRAIRTDDSEIIALADSIRENGLREPIVVTLDHFILSGHRRFAAAKLAGLTEVECRVEQICRLDDIDAFTRLLAEYNRQRVKGRDEKLREEILAIDPNEAHQALIKYRNNRAAVPIRKMKIVGKQTRSTISPARQPFLDAVRDILDDYEEYLPIGERKIHYALLNDPPLIHASKPKSRYRNDKKSSKALSDLVTRARLAGLIPFESISDETRPVISWDVYDDVKTFIRDQLSSMFHNGWRNLPQSQPNHIEILVEKNTMLPIVKPIAMEYCIRVTSGRGYSSLPPRWEMAQRFKKSGKHALVVLILSDLDPDGVEIADSYARSMRDDFNIDDIHCVRVALTPAQVRKFKIKHPIDPREKKSANLAKFTKLYGNSAYELEALEPADLQSILRKAIDGVIDHGAFEHEVNEEGKDAAFLVGVRKRVTEALSGLNLDFDDEATP
jgi:hypothetical protein